MRNPFAGTPVDWLIVGLGNPGPGYAETPHNVGFKVADELGAPLGPAAGREEVRGRADRGPDGSGRPARRAPAAADVHERGRPLGRPGARRRSSSSSTACSSLHDEIDLPFGEIRARLGGGLAGHNGLKSLKREFGAPDFHRVRIGVGRPDSTDPEIVAAYVLGRWRQSRRRGAVARRRGRRRRRAAHRRARGVTASGRPRGRPAGGTRDGVLRAAAGQYRRGERIDLSLAASEAGVGRSTAHRWFGAREDLIAEVLVAAVERVVSQAAAARTHTGAEGLLEVFDAVNRALAEAEPLRRFLELERDGLRMLARSDGGVQPRVVALMEELIDAEREAGRYEPPVDAGTLAYAIVRLAEAFLLLRRGGRDPRRRGSPARRRGGPARAAPADLTRMGHTTGTGGAAG